MEIIRKVKIAKDSVSSSEINNNPDALVVAKVPQGYESKINVRLVPERNIGVTLSPKRCKPRGNAPGGISDTLNLPDDLIVKLKDADKKVVAWLAQDDANARFFMEKPAEALAKAGVDLSRSDQKTIDRAHKEVRDVAMIAPGVKVEDFTVSMFPRGHIGKIKPGVKPQDENTRKKGCAKED